MTAVYEYERRSVCIQTEGSLEGLGWCELGLYSREDLGFSYKDIFILGLSWPSHLISSEHNSISLLSKVPPSRGKEEMPPVGINQALNDPQVRWCIFEEARLEMMKMMAMTDDERADLKEETDIKEYAERAGILKKYTAKYDERCTGFNTKQGNLDRIEQELLFEGKSLQAEGAGRMMYFPQSTLNTVVN